MEVAGSKSANSTNLQVPMNLLSCAAVPGLPDLILLCPNEWNGSVKANASHKKNIFICQCLIYKCDGDFCPAVTGRGFGWCGNREPSAGFLY